MARIIRGPEAIPYGAFDPGSSSPRGDLLFRKFLADMQAHKDREALMQEQQRKAGIEERGMRVRERGVELDEKEYAKSQEPLMIPPSLANEASKHFKMKPEEFYKLDKPVQISMIGEMIKEAGRERERNYQSGLEAQKRARLDAEKADAEEEAKKLEVLQGQYAALKGARARLEEERGRIGSKYTGPRAGLTESILAKQQEEQLLDQYFDALGEFATQLEMKQPLDEAQMNVIRQIREDIASVRKGKLRYLGGGLQKEAGAGEPTPGKTVRKAQKDVPEMGIKKGDWMIYMGNNEWNKYEPEQTSSYRPPSNQSRYTTR